MLKYPWGDGCLLALLLSFHVSRLKRWSLLTRSDARASAALDTFRRKFSILGRSPSLTPATSNQPQRNTRALIEVVGVRFGDRPKWNIWTVRSQPFLDFDNLTNLNSLSLAALMARWPCGDSFGQAPCGVTFTFSFFTWEVDASHPQGVFKVDPIGQAGLCDCSELLPGRSE